MILAHRIANAVLRGKTVTSDHSLGFYVGAAHGWGDYVLATPHLVYRRGSPGSVAAEFVRVVGNGAAKRALAKVTS